MANVGFRFTVMLWLLVIITCVQAAKIAGLQNETAQAHDVKPTKRHPCLYFSYHDIDALREKARTTHRHIVAELRSAILDIKQRSLPPLTDEKFTKSWNEVYGNNLPPLALYHLLFPDKKLLNFIKVYMDRMASYDRWMVASSPQDEVPLAHHVTGFATALDFVFNDLDSARQKKYLAKLSSETKILYDESFKKWWGKSYLQNHVATNYMGLLIGGLMSRDHGVPAARDWVKRAVANLETNMKLLKLIDDGTLNEGVGYVSYTMRSFTQYVFLAQRHLSISHHRRHSFFEEHFSYYYYTVLPGFTRTVGIGDAPFTWFYGPESQLVFLDAFYMRTGHGYWLADKIRKYRMDSQHRALSQRYVTLHTEFIWYDATLERKPPANINTPELHHFRDLGLVTFRAGSILEPSTTFFSFKAGKLHGKAVHDLVAGYDVISEKPKGWYMFNPGHEHPDQTSFIFFPRGIPFVTENYYAPKYTHLDNVLMFGPVNDTASCNPPWAGQLGDCKKFLTWKSGDEKTNRGTILYTHEKDGVMVTVGESTHAYSSKIGLQSVLRTTVLLDSDVLIVVDSVTLKSVSSLKYASTYFNNRDLTFEQWSKADINGARIDLKNANNDLLLLWLQNNGASPRANITSFTYASSGGMASLSNVNITYPLRQQTSLLSIFRSSSAALVSLRVKYSASSFHISAQTLQKNYSVVVPCLARRPSHFEESLETSAQQANSTVIQNQFRINGVQRFNLTDHITPWERHLTFVAAAAPSTHEHQSANNAKNAVSRGLLNKASVRSGRIDADVTELSTTRYVIYNVVLVALLFAFVQLLLRKLRFNNVCIKYYRKLGLF